MTAAVAELGAGIGLLVFPPQVVDVLIGLPLGSAGGPVVARIAGVALAVIGLICWLEGRRAGTGVPSALLAGLFVYNAAVPVLLTLAYLRDDAAGIGLWPAVAAHLALALWSAACLRARPPSSAGLPLS